MGCGASSTAKQSQTVVGVEEALRTDKNNDGKISEVEMSAFIDQHAELYAMLAVNLNLPEDDCKQVATKVAYQMAKKPPGMSLRDMSEDTKQREPTREEFQWFVTHYVHDPKGQQEFFHRTVFTVYDTDGNGYIDRDELDKFLDIFYEAGSIFAGDERLPPKEELKQTVLSHLDTNGDGKLQFDELRSLISGGAEALELKK